MTPMKPIQPGTIRKGSWIAAAMLLLGACATPATKPAAPAYDAAAIVQAIRAAGAATSSELEVQPLRDPQVEDLRQQAVQLEARHM
jgi:hypothetical protein